MIQTPPPAADIWNTDRPKTPAWYVASTLPLDPEMLRFWDGSMWSAPVHGSDPVSHLFRAKSTVGESQIDVQWKHLWLRPGTGEVMTSTERPNGPLVFPTPRECVCPGVCLASADGWKRGRVSAISDVVCRAAAPPQAPALVATAPDLLAAAAGHMRDRATAYDQPSGERSMGRTVAAFNEVTGQTLTESEGWLFMEVLKAVRDFTTKGGHADSQEDRIAYAALGAEARRAGR